MTRATTSVKSWFVVPLGVFVVLLIALRDPLACVNLVVTMLLTYLFALGRHALRLFITCLGNPKVWTGRFPISCSSCWSRSGSTTTSS